MDINEMAGKYGLAPLEEFQKTGDEIEFYRSFLALTDYIPNKIIESLIENLADATALNFIGVFVQFIADVRIHYSDVLKLRKKARAEINRLEGETVPEPTETVAEGETT